MENENTFKEKRIKRAWKKMKSLINNPLKMLAKSQNKLNERVKPDKPKDDNDETGTLLCYVLSAVV